MLLRVIHVGTKHSDVIDLLVDDHLMIRIITNLSKYAANRKFEISNKVELWLRITYDPSTLIAPVMLEIGGKYWFG